LSILIEAKILKFNEGAIMKKAVKTKRSMALICACLFVCVLAQPGCDKGSVDVCGHEDVAIEVDIIADFSVLKSAIDKENIAGFVDAKNSKGAKVDLSTLRDDYYNWFSTKGGFTIPGNTDDSLVMPENDSDSNSGNNDRNRPDSGNSGGGSGNGNTNPGTPGTGGGSGGDGGSRGGNGDDGGGNNPPPSDPPPSTPKPPPAPTTTCATCKVSIPEGNRFCIPHMSLRYM